MGGGHGHGRAHRGEAEPTISVGRWARLVVIGLIVLSGLAATAAVVGWWPDEERVDAVRGVIPFAAEGVELVDAELVEVRPSCSAASAEPIEDCGDSSARVLGGPAAGSTVPLVLPPDVVGTGLRSGDRVELVDATATAGDESGATFSFYRADRGGPMIWLGVLFAVAVVAVALKRGVMALLSLGVAGVIVVGFLIPALLAGGPPIAVTLAASVLILIAMLYFTHGVSMRTSIALAGALIGIGLAALLAWAGVLGARLGGLGEQSAGLLTYNVDWIDVQQLVVASVLLASLGTLNDVTVTQASALWELRGASDALTRRQLFGAAMRIGRDHVASTVYTLVFAYLGTALVLLVAVQLTSATPLDLVTSEEVAEEIVRTLVGGIAVVLTMPITTAAGALVVASATVGRARHAGGQADPPMPHHAPRTGIATPDTSRYRELPPQPWDEQHR